MPTLGLQGMTLIYLPITAYTSSEVILLYIVHIDIVFTAVNTDVVHALVNLM